MKQLYQHNNDPYILHRRISINSLTKDGKVNMDFIKGWRDYLGCDHVLRNKTHFLFVETIQEVEFEEILLGSLEE